jgi:L-methionine (R)-S-oxide reductase
VTVDAGHQVWLDEFLERHDGVAGTVHVEVDGDLVLTAARNIPPRLEQIVAHITRGKGMAGAAQIERRTVQTCNLQNADGPINPAAREAGGAAAAAIPVLRDDGVRAVVGITFPHEGELAADVLGALERDAAGLPGAALELGDQ